MSGDQAISLTLNDVQAGSRLAIGILVVVNAGLAFNVDHGAIAVSVSVSQSHGVSSPLKTHFSSLKCQLIWRRRRAGNVPLGQAQQEVLPGPLSEACDAKPARLAVVLGARVAGDGVFENFAAVAGGMDLGGISEVTDNGDASDSSRGRSAE